MVDLAWYWWAAIVAAVAGLYYWFYVRRDYSYNLNLD